MTKDCSEFYKLEVKGFPEDYSRNLIKKIIITVLNGDRLHNDISDAFYYTVQQ